MRIVSTGVFPSVLILTAEQHEDSRGFLSEVWHEEGFKRAGIKERFVQDNHVLSRAVGTLRGMHFQVGKNGQAKLIRCVRGRIFDVAVDIRRGSPTFGRHVAVDLSAKNWRQVYVPVGFAHGYCTLEPDTEVIYKVSAYYDPAAERGISWDDPTVGIEWPVSSETIVLSERDKTFKHLAELPNYFTFGENDD